MQSTLTFRTNRDLFSNHYLTEHLPETEQWQEVPDEDVESAYENVRELWESEQDLVEGYNEASLQNNFIDPILEELGITFEIEETVERTARRPDYAFFADADARTAAFERRDEGGDFYENAIAVADAKRWGRKLDTRGERERDFENPSYQIHVYLQETPTQWAVLTNGRKWRLYYGPTSHRLDSYYEIDLPTLLEQGGLEEFRYFYLFFRREAFVEDASGDCFLDDVYDESTTFAEALGEDLQDNIYEAIRVLAEGFLDGNDDLDEDDLDRIHDSSLIYLYRLIFVLYAESEGRELLPTDNDIYSEHYSLNQLKRTVADNLDDSQEHYLGWQTDLWDRLGELFDLINDGSESRGIDRDQLYIPAYNGGLFRTNPDEDDSVEAQFLANHEAGDAYLAEVLDLLTRREADNGAEKAFVDYSSLDIRHLGSIYEGLLEYQLNIAEEPLTLDDGEYMSADDGDDIVVAEGNVYLTTGSGERKATGSYYTPEYIVEHIVENSIGPLLVDIREDLVGQSAFDEGGFAEEFADRVFELKILDPAMGSGHFLTNAVDYLAREIINAQERQAEQQGIESIDQARDINWARRQVAQRCIYGVDLNPLAVELSKVSLWLRTLAAEQPLAFLDHHLKTGNSLVGSNIEDVLSNGESETAGGQLTLQQSFNQARRQALEHVMDRFQDLLSIDNDSLEDIKEMEAAFEEVRDDALYQHLLSMANVHTAEVYGLDIPHDAYEEMAEALLDNSWEDIEDQDWFESAQAMSDNEEFFHWELEFPVAFYDTTGTELSDPGFDAVIGNPPYVGVGGDLDDYLRNMYDSPEYFIDTFHVFIEQGIRLAKEGRQFAYIVPEPWLTMENTEQLREYVLNNTSIQEIIQFDNKVFDEATVDTIILNAQKTNSNGEIAVRKASNTKNEIVDITEKNTLNQARLIDTPVKRIEVRQSKAESEILDDIEERAVKISEIADVSIGIQAYNSSKHTEEQIENRVFHTDHKVTEDHLPEISGQDVSRYHVEHDGETWVKYGDHLHDYRPMRYFTEPRILVREITDSGRYRIHAAYTDEMYCNYKTILNILPHDEYNPLYLLAVLNSAPMSWVFLRTSNKVVSDTFPRISVADIEDLVVPALENRENEILVDQLDQQYRRSISSNNIVEIMSTIKEAVDKDGGCPSPIHDFLSNIAADLMDWRDERDSINLNLLDYLGNYGLGDNLSALSNAQPATGVHDTILAETTEGKDGLRIGSLTWSDNGETLSLKATVRYKPEDDVNLEDGRWSDRDQYGFVESKFEIPALEFHNLDDEVEMFIREFVRTAADEANGFAGFYRQATKNNSLIDRFKGITLPELDDVEQDVKDYLKQKERYDDLNRRLDLANRLIDQIVYHLYGLDDNEIEIIEKAIQED